MEIKSSRRQFFTRAGQLLGVAVVAPTVFGSLVFAQERRRPRTEGGAAAGGATPAAGGAAGGDLTKPMVDINSPQAKAVNYVLKHSDLKKPELKTERSGVPFEKQTCKGCTFYKDAGKKNGSEVGNCTVLSNNLVPAGAWCASWAKKA